MQGHGISTGVYSRTSVFGIGMPTDVPTLEQEISTTEDSVAVGVKSGVKKWLIMGAAIVVVLHFLGK